MSGKPSSRRVTLANIADHAGVSVTTVSLILSNRDEWVRQFRADTVHRVRDSAKRLGYRANLFASGLPNKSCPFFALIIRDLGEKDPQNWHLWAFEGELLAGVIKEGRQRNLHPIIATAQSSTDPTAFRPLENIMDGGVFGTIIRTPDLRLEEVVRRRLRRGQRIVVVFPHQRSRWPKNAVTLDDCAVGRMAGELLAARGRKKWAVVHYTRNRQRDSHLARRQAFEAVARETGVTVTRLQLPRLADEVTPQQLARLRHLGADGFFGLDSVLSICTLLSCFKAGLQPSTDIDLVGVNCSQWHGSPLPSITSIDVSWREAGSLAVRRLAQLTEGSGSQFDTILMRPQLHPGDTCPAAPAPCDRPAQ